MAIEDILNASARSTGPIPPVEEEKPGFISDTLLGIPRGVEGAVQSIYDLADFATGDDLLPDYDTRFLGRSQRFGGQMTEGITQFLTGFIPIAGQVSKVGKLSKVTKAGKKALNWKGNVVAGAAADFTMFQAQEERLSNLIESFPSLNNPITEFLAADGNDGEIEGRLKNTLEGLGIGAAVDGIVTGVKALKRARRGDDPSSIIKEFNSASYDLYEDQMSLRQDYDETEQFRATLDDAFYKQYKTKLTDNSSNAPAYEVLKVFNSTYEGEFKPLIESLLANSENNLKNTKIDFGDLIDSETGKKLSSGYRSSSQEITMRNGGVRTFVHEMLHAATSNALAKELEFPAQMALGDEYDEVGEVVANRLLTKDRNMLETLAANKGDTPSAGLVDAYLKVVDHLGLSDEVFGRSDKEVAEGTGGATTPYGLSNLDEFITESFTNPEFRKVLMSIKTENPQVSMFDKFMNILKTMFGVEGKNGNLLDDVFLYTDQLVRDQEAMFDGSFDYLKSIDELNDSVSEPRATMMTPEEEAYYFGEFGQQRLYRTLDDRGEDFTAEAGETLGKDGKPATPISEMQADEMFTTRRRTADRFEFNVGTRYKGKDISEVPRSYLKKVLTWDSVDEATKDRIDLELKATDKEYQEATKDSVPTKFKGDKKTAKEKLDIINDHTETRKAIKHIQESIIQQKRVLEKTPASTLPDPKNPKDKRPDQRGRLEEKLKQSENDLKIAQNKLQRLNKIVGDADLKKRKAELQKELELNPQDPRSAVATSPLTVDEITNTVVAPTAKEAYLRYRKSRTGGLANPRLESLDQYVENRWLHLSNRKPAPNQEQTDLYLKKYSEKLKATMEGIEKGSKSTTKKPKKATVDLFDTTYRSKSSYKDIRNMVEGVRKGEYEMGQQSLDDLIENAIDGMAKTLETGGDQAILSAAKNIRTTHHAMTLIQGIARNLSKTGVNEKVTAATLEAETKEMVDLLGGNESTWLEATRRVAQKGSLQEFRDAQRATKTLMSLMSADIVDTAKALIASPAANVQAKQAEFVSKLDQLYEVQRIWSLMGQEAGLSLLQRKFLGNAKGRYKLNKDVGFDQIAADPESYARFESKNLGGQNARDLAAKLAMAKNEADVDAQLKAVTGMAKEVRGNKMTRMVTEYWMNSLLSGPTTQVVNTLGSGLTTALRMGELLAGSLMSLDTTAAKAVFQHAFSMEMIWESFRMAGKAWNLEDAVLTQGATQFDKGYKRSAAITRENLPNKLQGVQGAKGTIGTAVDAIGTGVRLPSRALVTVDEFFKQLNYRMYVRSNLALEAMNKNPNSTGREVAEYVTSNFNKYITHGGRAYNEANLYSDAVEAASNLGLDYGVDQRAIVQTELAREPFNPERGALADKALEYANVNTFTNDIDENTVVGKLGNLVGSAKNKLPLLNFVVPFVKTPTNILKFSLDRTPVGLVTELTARRKQLTEGLNSSDPLEQAQVRGRIATGVSFSAAMLWYAQSNKDFLTGGGPPSPEERSVLKTAGWQPYSFRIPDGKGGHTYVSYQRTDPLATIIGLFADMAEAEKYYDLDDNMMTELFSVVAMSFTQNVTNKSYVKGLDALLNAVRDPVNNSSHLVGGMVGGFMPTFFTQLQNAGSEKTLREARGVLDHVTKRSPLASSLPAKRNFMGEKEVYTNAPMGLGVVNPFYYSKESNDVVDQEIMALLHGFNKPDTKLMGSIELRDIYNEDGSQAYDKWLEKTGTTKINGQTLRQTLRKMIKSKDYQALPAQSDSSIGEKSPRIRAINNWLRAYRKKAKNEMISDFPELQASLAQLQQQKQQYRLVQ